MKNEAFSIEEYKKHPNFTPSDEESLSTEENEKEGALRMADRTVFCSIAQLLLLAKSVEAIADGRFNEPLTVGDTQDMLFAIGENLNSVRNDLRAAKVALERMSFGTRENNPFIKAQTRAKTEE